jgi:hypothetical protein
MAKRKSTRPSKKRTAAIKVPAIETEELRLTDAAGTVRAVLEMVRSCPSLTMMNEDGSVALELILSKDGPSIRLADDRGETRIFLGAIRGTSRLGMADADGAQRLFAGVNSAGKPSMHLYDADQHELWNASEKK